MICESTFVSRIRDIASIYGLSIDTGMFVLFQRYYELLNEWNTRVNLVSGRDLKRFAEYHILDALKVASVFDFSGVHTMMDFGSGSGVPGIPLSISFPGIETILVESRKKRFAFLEAACSFIPVPNARAVHSRIESLDRSLYDSFDVVITRATVSLSDFYCLTSCFLSKKGSLIAIKGDTISDEVTALNATLDTAAFSLTTATPKPIENVRGGTVVIMTRR